MKRWVWLGLLGLVACTEKPVEPQSCPGTDVDPVEEESALVSQAGEEAVLVRFKASRTPRSPLAAAVSSAAKVERVGARVTDRLLLVDMVMARVTPEQRRALEADPDVEAVTTDRPVHAFGFPMPPPAALLGATQGSVGEYTDGLKLVQAPLVWDPDGNAVLDPGAPTGQGIKVCIIDSGYDPRHPELQGSVVGGRDFIENDDTPYDANGDDGDLNSLVWGGGHGTHVAGTIAAQLGQGGSVLPGADPNGVVGVAPGAQLLIARVLDTKGDGTTSNVLRALEWCTQQPGVKIVSLSLGSNGDADDPNEKAAFEAAWNKGVLIVAASGNGGKEVNSPKVAMPARYESVVAVGAVTMDMRHPTFSQFGPELDLVGPGVNVLSSMVMGTSAYSIVTAGGSQFASMAMEYSGKTEYSGTIVNCGLGDSTTSCGVNRCEGFVAYVDRGTITFGDKVRNVRKQGALGVIFGNNDPDDTDGMYTLGAPGRWPPSAIVSYASAASIREMAGREATVKLVGVDYAVEVGTSMATPHVSGVAALVWSARPSLTNTQVRDILYQSAKDLGETGKDVYFGNGLVQAKAALDAVNAMPAP
ncbi:S8 family serine peptidase [Myxococcaceae bacterium GXIMD 01537]